MIANTRNSINSGIKMTMWVAKVIILILSGTGAMKATLTVSKEAGGGIEFFKKLWDAIPLKYKTK